MILHWEVHAVQTLIRCVGESKYPDGRFNFLSLWVLIFRNFRARVLLSFSVPVSVPVTICFWIAHEQKGSDNDTKGC